MRKLFVESSAFTKWVSKNLDDEEYASFQKQVMERPEMGAVIPGCGGLRKLRLGVPTRQIGKRGGARVIYLHVPEANWILLLDAYGKHEKQDLSLAERKILKELAEEFKRRAIQATNKVSGESL